MPPTEPEDVMATVLAYLLCFIGGYLLGHRDASTPEDDDG